MGILKQLTAFIVAFLFKEREIEYLFTFSKSTWSQTFDCYEWTGVCVRRVRKTNDERPKLHYTTFHPALQSVKPE